MSAPEPAVVSARSSRLIIVTILTALVCVYAWPLHAQARRNIKVLLESRQSGTTNQESLQGSGSVIIRRGTVQPSGRVTGADRQTTVERSSGIFTLVLDGGESILTVATRVPQSEVLYYYNRALGIGAIERRIVFTDVGTSLRVNAATLADGQIQLRLIPRISYFSAESPGAIDFSEAATELIVPNGQPVSLAARQRICTRSRAKSSVIAVARPPAKPSSWSQQHCNSHNRRMHF